MRKLGMPVLFLSGMALGVDEYLPIQAGKFEVDFGYGLVSGRGWYGSDGEKTGPGGSPRIHQIPLQMKYGIGPGLTAEAFWAFSASNPDAGDAAGFEQPQVALKYGSGKLGAAAYANFSLPFGTSGDILEAPMALGLGGVYNRQYGRIRFAGLAGYDFLFENEGVREGDRFVILAKPEYMVNEFGGLFLGLRFDGWGDSEKAGAAQDDGGHLFSVIPGWSALWLYKLGTEVFAPIAVRGENAEASWGLGAKILLTLP